ncbi:primosomal protein N' [Rhodoplanes elegans]|uniref:Replication restart protein PriA n=1 Tax=Rhodoplanes elegans TaxID=29408 RepID=A0A327JZX4_9BRAD|nr:primosomal protein N' [Rhodoplanes elegans]MBK5960953.1 primosomal protein N' [Rhodoplanes elegans]RAI32080.1 primosomal protein N' [Rhodoplanes elegans]
MARRIVDVLLPLALDQPYSYAAGDHAVAPGDLVTVPLGTRACTGVVWGDNPNPDPRLDNRIKAIADKLDVPPLRDEMRKLVDWVSHYTLAPRGMVLRMALRMGDGLGPERERLGVRLAGAPPQRMTAARARVLRALADGLVRGKGEAAKEAGVSPGVIDGLIDEGTLATVVLPPEPIARPPDADFAPPDLSPEQAAAAATLRDEVREKTFNVFLLDGVTGSGKTEVYFEGVAEAIRGGLQVLILMPEIALTAQSLDRFSARFGVRPAEWHSEITPRRRARTWQGVAEGDVQVVAGARSALFLPFADLGLIIVDEEHDPAYKQEDGVRYHARDMAVVRARIGALPIVLASATPSVETEVNARKGRYRRLSLPQRFGGQALPHVEAIDLSREGPPRGRWIAPRLAGAVKDAIERKQQALLFLNRRGYAPLTLCRACGYRFACPQCDAWLVDHRFKRQLVCHHCGFSTPHPPACPNCEAVDSFAACGPGVERLEEEVGTLFPEARVLVMSSDLLTSVEKLREELTEIQEGRVDIIIGTQLVAKGHHFPRLNLVGIVDADLGLANGDPRAAERTFQLLSQVAGRAGREEGQGYGLIQTHQPEHPVMRALIAGDREAFYASEIDIRERLHYPPFGRLASLIVSGSDRAAVETHARKLIAIAPRDERVRVLGPAEAPVSLLRGRHRFRLLIKSPRAFDLSGWMRDWLALAPKTTGDLKREIDIDPTSFL